MRAFLQMLIRDGKNGWVLVIWGCIAVWVLGYARNWLYHGFGFLKSGFTALKRTNNAQQRQVADMERELEEIKQKQLNQ